MSGKVKHRATANTAESATITVNEKILRECHNLYTDEENGTSNTVVDYPTLIILFLGHFRFDALVNSEI